MKKMYKKFLLFINKNIGRKLIFSMVPITCGIMTITIMLVTQMYTKHFVENLEEGTRYLTDTFKINMDFCTTDVKLLLNTISLDENIKELITLDSENIDYAKRLICERQMKKLVSSMTSMKNYVQDIFIIGKNGYQYNYLGSLKGNLTEKKWFQENVDLDEKGFQYILPHDTDYYETGKKPAKQAMSIVLAIKINNEIEGYAVCDIRMDKAAIFPEWENKELNAQAFLADFSSDKFYNFQKKRTYEDENAVFWPYIEEKQENMFVNGDDFIVYSCMESGDWAIVVVYPYKNIIAPATTAQKIGIVMLFMGCIMIFVVARMISRSIRRPITDILVRMKQVENQNFEPIAVVSRQNQPGEILLIRNKFEEMIQQINELVHKIYLDEIYQKNMEYDNLVNQVNPHFIYNVLQLIQAKAVMSENYEIDDIVVALSRLMRYTMSNKKKFVAIKEEVSYIESYLQLYEQRYSNKFSFEVHVESGIEGYPVLKFILQPVVENCVKHGFKNLKRKGHVNIHIYQNDGRIYFITEDNGHGIGEERLKEIIQYLQDTGDQSLDSVGLKNTCQRLNITYGDLAGMEIDSKEEQFTKITCYIPFEERKNV